MDWSRSWGFQTFSLLLVPLPQARLTCAVPNLATSASSPSVMEGCALSASMSTASLAVLSPVMLLLPVPDGTGHDRPQPASVAAAAAAEEEWHWSRNVVARGESPTREPPLCADVGWSLNKTLAIQTWMFCAGAEGRAIVDPVSLPLARRVTPQRVP